METCEKCGALLSVADWPWCPHGKTGFAAHPDDIPGGQWQENGLPEPRKFYSKSERDRVLAEHGNMIAPRWVPNDKHLINWAAGIDAKTLENAAVLMTRRSSKPDPVPSAPPQLIQALKDALYR